jgi:hypothetical protein
MAADATAREYETVEADHRESAKAAAELLVATSAEHAQLKADAVIAQREEEELNAAHDRLAGHQRLVSLAEADGTVNVWGDAARLRLLRGTEDADERGVRDADVGGMKNPARRCRGGVFVGEVPVVIGMVPDRRVGVSR